MGLGSVTLCQRGNPLVGSFWEAALAMKQAAGLALKRSLFWMG